MRDEDKRRKIMLVDDDPTDLAIGKSLLKDAYEVYALPSGAKLFEFLESVTPDLILLDVEMPEMGGHEIIKALKRDQRHADIPIIFLTARTDKSDELEGLTLGAIDYVTKPFSASLLLRRIEIHLMIQRQKRDLRHINDNLINLVRERTARVYSMQNAIITTVADLVEFRDDNTGGHVLRTQMYLRLMVERLLKGGAYVKEALSWNMDFLLPSAQLHDVGKIAVSDAILNKPGKLTPEEFAIMQTHVDKGVETIDRIRRNSEGGDFLEYARSIAWTHHEKWDGTGYPRGLKGRDIPLEGRVMALADVYDALISLRPYKKPLSHGEAERIIIEGAGKHFDPVIVGIFTELSGEFAKIAATHNEELIRKGMGTA